MGFITELDKLIIEQELNIKICKTLGMDILAEKTAFAIIAFKKAKQIYINEHIKRQ